MSETQNETITPLYLRGCKITLGARAGPPPPSWRKAKMLVFSRRASSRIMKPAAATAIQQAYRHVLHLRAVVRATTKLQATARRLRVVQQKVRMEHAATVLQAAARRRQAVVRVQADAQARVVARIQAAARGRYLRRHLREENAAARTVQASWRMARSRVVGQRLAGAQARLQAGVRLAKYQAGGLSHERHERFVWLSKDRTKLCWTHPAAQDARCSATDKGVAMERITAVAKGVQTPLMKKMDRRAGNPTQGTTTELLQKLAERLGARRARELDEQCAVSLIGSERVLDLYAPDEATRTQWLRDVRTLLVYSHTLEHSKALGAVEAGIRRGSLAEPVAAAA